MSTEHAPDCALVPSHGGPCDGVKPFSPLLYVLNRLQTYCLEDIRRCLDSSINSAEESVRKDGKKMDTDALYTMANIQSNHITSACETLRIAHAEAVKEYRRINNLD